MEALRAPLRELGEFEEIQGKLKKREPLCLGLSGCVDSQKLHMIYGLGEGFRYRLIITYSDQRMREIYEDYKFYDRNVCMYPAKDLIFFQADIHGNQLVTERWKVLRRMLEGVPMTIVTTLDALMEPQIPLEKVKRDILHISTSGQAVEKELAEKLVTLGYEKTYQVEVPGQFSIRGGIVDIFDLTEENPYRIELWGEDVDSIRSFDVLSQRSIENLSSVDIYPATEMILTKDQRARGMHLIELEAKKQEKALQAQGKTEEAARLRRQTGELREEVLELEAKVNLESYVRYFYQELGSFLGSFDKKESCIFLDEPVRIGEHAEAVELEFRESMSHRLEMG